jgi:hypothetical protein
MRIFLGCSLFVLSALGAFAQETNFATGPQYLMISGSPQFARSISTPSMSLAGPPLEVGASNATGALTPGAGDQNVLPPSPDALPLVNLSPILYGVRPPSVIEISVPANSESSGNQLPPSILDTGILQLTTPQALRQRGYGLTLPEAAANSKALTRHATRIYTNADLDRLHGSN